jgi:hypothetical protein
VREVLASPRLESDHNAHQQRPCEEKTKILGSAPKRPKQIDKLGVTGLSPVSPTSIKALLPRGFSRLWTASVGDVENHGEARADPLGRGVVHPACPC